MNFVLGEASFSGILGHGRRVLLYLLPKPVYLCMGREGYLSFRLRLRSFRVQGPPETL